MDNIQIAKKLRGSIKEANLEEVKSILEKQPEMLNSMTPFGTWLHVASAQGHLEIVKYLVETGFDVNSQGGTFSTNALERASTKGHYDIVEYLLNQNIEIDTSEPDRNPLFAAIYGGHKEIVKLLIGAGIDISIRYTGDNMKNMGAYEFAVERGQTDIAEYLKQKLQEM
ncbi:ankyrin repeat domain-containing protein [Tepidibacter mesophilus]|uniref:ankyrin repeat domain-containing protein n=1 Tax=Tepidibacter mesophilus TaxID=655607 RepID=UPI000C07B80C|nr:ankyrin repeat domain-containing protein [Tepidibacter mesophilus]